VPAAVLAGTRAAPAPPPAPEAPLLVLVNAAAGGRAGAALAAALRRALGADQVFDLAEHDPAVVLKRVYENLTALASAGDYASIAVRSRLVLLAAGGDGTVAWVLKAVSDLKLTPPPAVAVLPLGTGNDLALSFGWGNRFVRGWVRGPAGLYATLKRVADGEPRDLDAWAVTVSRPPGAPAFDGLPHALTPDHGAPLAAAASASGSFYNYLSVGNDAQATHGFHALRETRPWAAPGRLINQLWYVAFGCLSGWFCGAPPARRRLALRARRGDGPWVDVRLPKGVRVVALLNLQSYAGGRDIWGLRDGRGAAPGGVPPARGLFSRLFSRRRPAAAPGAADDLVTPDDGFADASAVAGTQPPPPPPPPPPPRAPPGSRPPADPAPRPGASPIGADGWDPPIFNDGLIEVVGLRSGWHAGVAFTGLFRGVHGARLAQATAVELSFSGPEGGHGGSEDDCVFLQVDGEPWRQPIPPAGAPPLVVTVEHGGVSKMLLQGGALAGVPRRVASLAARERAVSLSTQVSLGRGVGPSPARAAALEMADLEAALAARGEGGGGRPPATPPPARG